MYFQQLTVLSSDVCFLTSSCYLNLSRMSWVQSLNCAPFAKVPYLYGTRIWENVGNCPSCLLAAFTVSLTLLHYYILQNDWEQVRRTTGWLDVTLTHSPIFSAVVWVSHQCWLVSRIMSEEITVTQTKHVFNLQQSSILYFWAHFGNLLSQSEISHKEGAVPKPSSWLLW